MSLTDRDKKLMMVLVPILLLGVYWFLVLAPQRSEVSKLDDQLVAAEAARDESVAEVQRLESSRNDYAKDYATVVRLGKAIPSTLDMPSLLVQLESAAKGTGIDFDSITVGDRTNGAAAAADSSGADSSSGSSERPVEAGGEQAQSGAGQAAEKANNAADTANDRNAAGGDNNASQDGSESGSSAPVSPVAGLDTVPLNFNFVGSYFDLADFFHRVKRFVRVANSDIRVRGRLMTIDGMNLTTKGFPRISAQLTATIYLSPKSEGATGGGTAQGPTATPASTTSTPQSSSSGSTPTAPQNQTQNSSSTPNQ